MSKPHIVVVEDNPGDVQLLRIALDQQAEEYELSVLADGAEAVQYVQSRHAGSTEPQPCAMLLDFRLPKYDGLEVLAALRREPSLDHVHVIILSSATVQLSEKLKIVSLGAIFREKPRTFLELAELAAHVLELCKGAIAVG